MSVTSFPSRWRSLPRFFASAANAAKVSAATAMLKFGRESIELDDLAARIETLESEREDEGNQR